MHSVIHTNEILKKYVTVSNILTNYRLLLKCDCRSIDGWVDNNNNNNNNAFFLFFAKHQ